MAIIMKSAMSNGDQPFGPRCLDRLAIATKSAPHAHRKRLRSLRGARRGSLVDRGILVCRGGAPPLEDGIEIWQLEHFLAALWNDDL